mgnify:CR=1 FL=1
MRQIKFRGKSIELDEWLYGDLSQNADGTIHIIPQNPNKHVYELECNPETVGQFTGLYDKDGKEIYEGDIIEYMDGFGLHKERDVIKYRDGGFEPIWSITIMRDIEFLEVKVKGNEIDNPELLNV